MKENQKEWLELIAGNLAGEIYEIHHVPERGKPKQSTRTGTLRFDTTILEDGFFVAMLRVSKGERNEKWRWCCDHCNCATQLN